MAQQTYDIAAEARAQDLLGDIQLADGEPDHAVSSWRLAVTQPGPGESAQDDHPVLRRPIAAARGVQLVVVVHRQDFEKINMLEVKAFLDTL
ncbi:hypothetical protein [Actinophytocola glycyrrhizae]|uniref:Uncharacterized protein n=1 Tax=Actinophytocola glycyrrhizae TaxID=2044873 RepID=A0ABV9S4X1_9PSEU